MINADNRNVLVIRNSWFLCTVWDGVIVVWFVLRWAGYWLSYFVKINKKVIKG